MSNYRQPRYSIDSMRSRPIAMSRAQLVASIHSGPSTATYRSKSLASMEDPEYYLSSTKMQRRYRNFCHWFHNPDTGQVMGRTRVQWFQLIIFYLIFYSVLAGMFAACLGVFMYAVIMADHPYLTGMQSGLQLSPGLGVIPQPDYWTSIISFRMQADSYSKYVDDIVAFTQWFEDYGPGAVINEDKRLAPDASDGGFSVCPRPVAESIKDTRRSCRQRLNFGGRCNMFQTFGFDEGMPCLILKLNRIYGWVPDPLDNQTGPIVKCYGLNDVDKDLLGPVCYHDLDDFEGKDLCNKPHGEFKSYFFPYLRQINYQSPLVIVEFVEPVRNTIIMVECRAYAKNIPYNPVTGEGTVRFELLVD